MALFEPTNVSPSSFAGIGGGTIDATQPLTISWQVNGSSPMLAYQIVIYQNNTASTQLLTTGKTVLSAPFYGVNYAGETQYFEASAITAAQMAAAGIVNGFADGYKLVITQWWGATDDESVSQNSASAFITRAAPTIAVNAYPNPITTNSYSFTATYAQAQGDTLNWVSWSILDDNGNVLKQTGNISGTTELRIDYDGFFPNNDYTIQCTIETQNGIQATTGAQPFTVSYPVGEQSGELIVTPSCATSSNQVVWSALKAVEGQASGTYTIGSGELTLSAGATVAWDNENGSPFLYKAPWTMIWKANAPNGIGGEMLTIQGTNDLLTLTADGAGITLKLNGETLANVALGGLLTDWTMVVVTPTTLYVQQVLESGGLYPDTTLYPNTTLYPQANTGRTIVTSSAELPNTYTQIGITSVTLEGLQKCKYLWITKEQMTSAEIEAILANANYEAEWTAETNFLAAFNGTLNAGNVSTAGYSIYRRDGSKTYLEHVLDAPIDMLALWDFSAKSQTAYTYYMLTRGTDAYTSAPMSSAVITPVFWSWTVLECQQGSDGAMHVIAIYPFALNVDSGDISNNNAPNLMKNFTPYPLRQPMNCNYASGTLKAYIGKSTDNQYEDSVELAEKIKALSVSTNPKYLKDRKGNLWKIETSAAIVMKNRDVSRPQPYTVSLPWAEVGSAKGTPIIATSADAIWPQDKVIQTAMRLDPTTGILVWETPDDYIMLQNGSQMTLSGNGRMTQETSPYFAPATMQITAQRHLTAQK
jgi:hypothetical protein